jgi:plastocyanin
MRIAVACLSLVVAVGCSSEAPDEQPDSNIRTLPSRTTGPYVSVAVDNHFHDIHPVDHKEVAAGRPFVVRNEGSNLHNVSISNTDISEDIKPGESFKVDPVSELGPPGTYKIFCKYHAGQNMRGEITIVEDASP